MSRPASFWPPLIRPNSLACLMAIVVSPEELASATISALAAWACSRNEEKSFEARGCLTAPSVWPPACLTAFSVSACKAWPNA
ncbi:hypothetical protein G6F59_018586 [Rhizopus arrhizus]|nr:hypothetical protein G6F59_018586 [Rhizopus arrhizus]